MKRIIYILMLFAVTALTSCSKESPGVPSYITFNVATYAPTTKAVNVTRYIMEVYTAADTNTLIERQEQATGTFTINLNNNTNYVCLFWADEGTAGENITGTYNALDLKNVTLNSTKEMAEAFFAKKDISGSISTHNITLTRPIAQVNFVATDNVTANTNLVATYSQYPGFNTLTENAIGTPVSTSKTFNSAATTGTLGSLFTFVSKVGINMDFTTVYSGAVSNTMPNTPLKANFKTNILGSYATGLQDFTIIITVDDHWTNVIEWVEINTGTKWIKVADRNALKDGTNGAAPGYSSAAADYGYYYRWSDAANGPNDADKAYKACFDFAEGSGAWRLPTSAEWISILGQAGYHSIDGNRKLKFDSTTTTWKLHSERSGQTSEFVYFPIAGKANSPGTAGTTGVGTEAFYWGMTETSIGSSNAWAANLDDNGSSGMSDEAKTFAFSVRCVKDV